MSRRRRNDWRRVGYPEGVRVSRPAKPEPTFPRREVGRIAVYDGATGSRRVYSNIEDYDRGES
ncbi:MAG: hypothetical protein BGO49_00555 [Planctomycetales bacterium 71-10]|nr:MAG: hypothetical protein BGO49_00555 [Planctomycetales bacterium 71-10]